MHACLCFRQPFPQLLAPATMPTDDAQYGVMFFKIQVMAANNSGRQWQPRTHNHGKQRDATIFYTFWQQQRQLRNMVERWFIYLFAAAAETLLLENFRGAPHQRRVKPLQPLEQDEGLPNGELLTIHQSQSVVHVAFRARSCQVFPGLGNILPDKDHAQQCFRTPECFRKLLLALVTPAVERRCHEVCQKPLLCRAALQMLLHESTGRQTSNVPPKGMPGAN